MTAPTLSITIEDYLKQILLLMQEGDGLASMGRLAEAVQVVPSTATAMMKKMAEHGLVKYEPYAGVTLTEHGRARALAVLRRHRLIEAFLVDALGLDWSEVHDEAERLEHAISDLVLERIDAFLGRPRFDPHGDPIPGPGGDVHAMACESLAACPVNAPVRIVRISDQDAAFLHFVDAHGLRPGTLVRVVSRDIVADSVQVRSEDGDVVVMGKAAAMKLLVEPSDSEMLRS